MNNKFKINFQTFPSTLTACKWRHCPTQATFLSSTPLNGVTLTNRYPKTKNFLSKNIFKSQKVLLTYLASSK